MKSYLPSLAMFSTICMANLEQDSKVVLREPYGNERYLNKEEEIIESLATLLKQKSSLEKAKDRLARPAHPKGHALLLAKLTMSEITDPRLSSHPLFTRMTSYDAVVRFSNGNQYDDRVGDLRGMAVRIFGINSSMGLPGSQMVDLLTLNRQGPIGKSEEFLQLVKATGPDKYGIASAIFWGALHPFRIFNTLRLVREISEGGKKDASLLFERYDTELYFAIDGNTVVRFAFAPLTHGKPKAMRPKEDVISSHFLRDDLQERLNPATEHEGYEFALQAYVANKEDISTQQLEDATVSGPERGAYVRIGILRIIPQHLSPKMDQIGANIAFNPWHGLRPLGSMGRAREFVYAASAKHRRETNGLIITEEPNTLAETLALLDPEVKIFSEIQGPE